MESLSYSLSVHAASARASNSRFSRNFPHYVLNYYRLILLLLLGHIVVLRRYAAYCYRPSSVVCRSVCLSVGCFSHFLRILCFLVFMILPASLVVLVERLVGCVCVCVYVCVCVRTITFEINDLWPRFLSLWSLRSYLG